MSGHSTSITCPNCNAQAEHYEDWKPYVWMETECLHCGFRASTETRYLNIEELNDRREEYDLEPLTELPKQSNDL